MYNDRVLNVEHGSFTPLVFSSFGGMARECKVFFQRLIEKVAEKRNCEISVASGVIKTMLSFSLLRSCLLCIRGTRSLAQKSITLIDKDIETIQDDCGIKT